MKKIICLFMCFSLLLVFFPISAPSQVWWEAWPPEEPEPPERPDWYYFQEGKEPPYEKDFHNFVASNMVLSHEALQGRRDIRFSSNQAITNYLLSPPQTMYDLGRGIGMPFGAILGLINLGTALGGL
jgi:hypothetical protein